MFGQCKTQTDDCRLPTADCRLQTADCRLQTADCRLQTADRRPGVKCSLNFSRLLLSLVSGDRRLKALANNAVQWRHYPKTWYWFWLVAVLNYSPDANNLDNFIAKLRPFTEDGGRKSRDNATRLKAVSGVYFTFEVQNLNPQQEKALAEFFSGSDVFVNLPTTFVGFFNDHSHAGMTPKSSKSARERTNYFCRYFCWGYGLNIYLNL